MAAESEVCAFLRDIVGNSLSLDECLFLHLGKGMLCPGDVEMAWEHADKAFGSLYGLDVNPAAVSTDDVVRGAVGN